jgi:hypothetical protein
VGLGFRATTACYCLQERPPAGRPITALGEADRSWPRLLAQCFTSCVQSQARVACYSLEGCATCPLRFSRAACCVAASDSWPLIDVTLSSGPRLGPLNDPLGACRRMQESFSWGRSVARTGSSRPEQRSGVSALRARFHEGRRAPLEDVLCGPNHGASPTTAPLVASCSWRTSRVACTFPLQCLFEEAEHLLPGEPG